MANSRFRSGGIWVSSALKAESVPDTARSSKAGQSATESAASATVRASMQASVSRAVSRSTAKSKAPPTPATT